MLNGAAAKAFFDEFSKEYEEQSRYKYLFYKWMVNTIFNQIDKERCRILDLGTGNGELGIRIAAKFPESQVIGLDVSAGMIRKAKEKAKDIGIKNIKFIISPVEKLKINKADFVVSNLALHHIKHKELVLTKVCQILPRSGKLIIGDWFRPSKDYEKQIEKLRKKNTERAKQFDESWEQALKAMSKEYKERHPIEYPICPTHLKHILEKAGFRKETIIRSPLPCFAVVVGVK